MTAVYHIRLRDAFTHTFDKVEAMDLIARTFPSLNRVQIQALFDDQGLTIEPSSHNIVSWFSNYFNADIKIGVYAKL